MNVSAEPPAHNVEPIGGKDIAVATLALMLGLAVDFLGVWLFGSALSFSMFFILGPVVLLAQVPINRAVLFDATVATLSVTLIAFIFNVIGSLIFVFPFGYQVFSAITAASFFGMLFGWRRFSSTTRAVSALSAIVKIPERLSRPNRFCERNGFGPWLGAGVAVCILIAIIDFGFPAASSALCGVGLAGYAFLRRWPLLVFDASLASLASLMASVLLSGLHIPFTVNALIGSIITYVVTLHWRELPYAARTSKRVADFFDPNRTRRQPPPAKV